LARTSEEIDGADLLEPALQAAQVAFQQSSSIGVVERSRSQAGLDLTRFFREHAIVDVTRRPKQGLDVRVGEAVDKPRFEQGSFTAGAGHLAEHPLEVFLRRVRTR
jgi:hypothetical protein